MLAQSSVWGVQGVQQTGISTVGIEQSALSLDGSIYLAVESQGFVLRKVTAGGQPIFSVPLAGVSEFGYMQVGPDGNVYLSGEAAAGFATPGAYEPTAGPDGGPFLCKFGGADGHVVYCTYADMIFPGLGGLSADPAGNAYLASDSCLPGTGPGCIEKINPSGTALVYKISFPSFGAYADSDSSIAADTAGNLYFAGYFAGAGPGGFLLVKFDPEGHVQAAASDPDVIGFGLQLDPAGNPQILTNADTVRRYSADLSTILFDTPVNGLVGVGVILGSDGDTFLLGGTNSANVALLHPTAACNLPSGPQYYGARFPLYPGAVLARLDNTGHLLQFTFAPVPSGIIPVGFAQAGGATVLTETGSYQIEIVNFGPMPEVQLACGANAASPVLAPLAPMEIVSLYGQDLGPAEPLFGQPGPDGRYPFSLAGTQVTFDGVAAPVLYAGANQINTVTPSSLSGQTTTHICVTVNGAPANCMDAPVQPANPAIFLAGSAGLVSFAAAVNQDGTINSESNPAPVGSVVSIFATGLGPLTPAPPDGSVIEPPLPSLALDVQVYTGVPQVLFNTIQFSRVNVLYRGPAPFEIEGLTQINIQVPASPFLYLFVNSETLITTLAGVALWVGP